METTVPPSAPERPASQAQMTGFARVIGVLTSPGETFADIVRKPTWFLPVLLLSVLGLGVAHMMNQRIDWKDYVRQQLDKSPRAADLPAEQKDRIATQQSQWSPPFAYALGGCGAIFSTLILGLVYWGAFNLLAGAQMRFGQSLGIVAHAELTGLISAPMLILILYLKEYGHVDPESMVASSLAAFLPGDAPRWLVSIGNSVELFWLWTMFLLALGFTAVNPRKIGMGKALGIIGGIWMLWVFIKVSLAAVFS